MNQTERPRLLVDIVSDPVCPWCYVGLKSFQHARDRLSDTHLVLPRIRAYELNPDTPVEGKDRVAHYKKKFPDRAQLDQMIMSLKGAAAGAGFQFDPLLPKHLPNTLKAHQLIRLAHFDGAQERAAEAIYAAYWDRAEDIGDTEVLLRIASEIGLDEANARKELESATNANIVKQEADDFRNAGVTGVPTFIVNERSGFSGAFPPARLAEALTQALN